MEKGNVEYKIVGEFLADLKKEFRRGSDKMMKVTELKKMEQENKTMEKFVQEFRRVARGSKYEGKPLVHLIQTKFLPYTSLVTCFF